MPNHTEQDEDEDRRKFLISCGRFAAVTTPAMTVLLSTSLTSTAVARSGGQSGDPSGSGGEHSFFDNGPDDPGNGGHGSQSSGGSGSGFSGGDGSQFSGGSGGQFSVGSGNGRSSGDGGSGNGQSTMMAHSGHHDGDWAQDGLGGSASHGYSGGGDKWRKDKRGDDR